MRKIGFQHGGLALGLALAAHSRNTPPVEQATAARHRGRDQRSLGRVSGALTAPSLAGRDRT